MQDDLRDFLKKAEDLDRLKVVKGADWDLEIGAATDLNLRKDDCPALLFDEIKGYEKGYRVLSCSASAPGLMAAILNLPKADSDIELLNMMYEKFPQWNSSMENFDPEEVTSGPVMENVLSGDDIDLFKFPVPKWHALDGGRYMGTGDAVITRDPDTGEVNLGTYRIQALDKNKAGFHVVPNQHGDIHRRKYHDKGKPLPIAISIGHHPLMLCMGALNIAPGTEYNMIGAIREEPVKVIKEEVTGLPIPADSEIVISGFCYPDKKMKEGPFGEYTGYYVTGEKERIYVEVERVYHRNEPILLGSPPSKPPDDAAYLLAMLRSARVYNKLKQSGLRGINGVWFEKSTNASFFVIVSIKQHYAGHAREVALQASLMQGKNGRYIIVVDEDINYTNLHEVLWAVCTRSDPVKDIDIIRETPSVWLDPIIHKPGLNPIVTSRAIIDACKPYNRLKDFPITATVEPETEKLVREKFKELNL